MDQLLERPRTYIIRKSHHVGYGFIAGHDLPTLIKKVFPEGPSYNLLSPGDIIMAINGIDVENTPREQIIKMVQLSENQIEITVRRLAYEEQIRLKNLQDFTKFYTSNRSNTSIPHCPRAPPSLHPNSSTLNRLVTPISQQQFPSNAQISNNHDAAPSVQIMTSNNVLKSKSNGAELDRNNNTALSSSRNYNDFGRHSPLPQRCKSSIGTQNGKSNKKSGDTDNDQPLLKRSNTMRPIRPPSKVLEIFEVVIKIFFETGDTRMLTYNQNTTVGTILENLHSRHVGNSPYAEQIKLYFGLALTVPEQPSEKKLLHILDENASIMKIRQLPYAQKLRLLYRMVYPPNDVSALYIQDKIAFGYLYQQSCNDLKLERFDPKLDQETALKLTALRLLEHVHSNHSKLHENSKDPKVYIKLIEKDSDLGQFLPKSLEGIILDKKGRRISGQYKKMKNRLIDHLKKNFDEFDFEPPKVKSTTNLNRYSTTSFHELSLPEMQSSAGDHIKLLFLNHLSQLPCYGNSRRPVRTSPSPIERSSGGEFSSSLESVPRTSDSSPLIRQDRVHNSENTNGRSEYSSNNNISRIAQMNSMRSLSSAQSSSIGRPVDQPDMVQTPSIESISSITFNMQNSPSPQQAHTFLSQQSESFNHAMTGATVKLEPSPMPRQQLNASKAREYNSIERLYTQRYMVNESSIEKFVQNVILLPPPPPPPPSSPLIEHFPTNDLTRVLTDQDLEKLRVPPPPRMLK